MSSLIFRKAILPLFFKNEDLINLSIMLIILTNHLTASFILPKTSANYPIEIINPKLIELDEPSSTESYTKLRYLLTFNTKHKVFYALLYDISHPIENPNDRKITKCDLYQGRLIAPGPGHIAATICPNDVDHWILYSTILFDDDIFIIRSAKLNVTEPKNPKKRINMEEFDNNNNTYYSTFEEQCFRNGSFRKFNSHYLYKFWTPTLKLNHSRQKQINVQKHYRPRRQIKKINHHENKKHKSLNSISNKVFKIETAIFVDQILIRRFNGARKELQKLILAIMNEVQLIYNFDTLKTRIRIIIKKIVYLDKNQDAPNTANGNIDQYLDNFCFWQKRLWKQADQNSRWDHALMLTGLDLYKQIGYEKNKKVLGLAWVNGMCRPSYSCTLNEGKNFESAFVIAHELAHSLGMLHDGYDNNCDPDKYIMSEKTGPGKIHWSPCSNLYLENFLKKTNLKCLEKTSDETCFPYTSPLDGYLDRRLPGERYTLNQQCQLALGEEYRAYITPRSPFNDICKELWCSHGNWASPAHPALEGSNCGNGKSCSQGVCMNKQQLSTGSKYNSYVNRLRSQNKMKEENSSLPSLKTNSGSTNSSTFMKKIQRFLRSTFLSIAKLFSG